MIQIWHDFSTTFLAIFQLIQVLIHLNPRQDMLRHIEIKSIHIQMVILSEIKYLHKRK